MLIVALTGGIATGKTYCLARFAALGLPVIDADRLAREAVEPGGPALEAIRERFGAAMLGPDGGLDRSRLGRLVFADRAARQDLERIVHPEVYRAIRAWYDRLAREGRHPAAMADIPLLFETGHQLDFDCVVVVACDRETQLAHLRERDGLGEREARQRLAAQWPIEEKVKRADFTIRTDGTADETDRQVDHVYREILARAIRTTDP